jgi:hypothetical protein
MISSVAVSWRDQRIIADDISGGTRNIAAVGNSRRCFIGVDWPYCAPSDSEPDVLSTAPT